MEHDELEKIAFDMANEITKQSEKCLMNDIYYCGICNHQKHTDACVVPDAERVYALLRGNTLKFD